MNHEQPKKASRVDPVDIVLIALRGLFTVALCTVAGFMVVGGIVGTAGLLLGWKTVAEYAPTIGWLLGAVFGLCEIVRIQKSKKSHQNVTKESDNTKSNRVQQASSRFQKFTWSELRFPTIKGLAKSIGVSAIFGIVFGLITSVFLSLLLISVYDESICAEFLAARNQAAGQIATGYNSRSQTS